MGFSSPTAATVSLSLLFPSPTPLSCLHRSETVEAILFSYIFNFLNSAMNLKNEVDKNSRKRKTKELDLATAEEPPQQINLFNFQDQQFASSNVPLNAHQSQVQQIRNTFGPFRPFTSTSWGAFKPFTSTPLGSIVEDDADDNKSPSEQIDQIIIAHGQKLSTMLVGMLVEHHRVIQRIADERTTKKLKERELELQACSIQNVELEDKALLYSAEIQKLQGRLRYIEEMTMSLESELQDAVEARKYAENSQEDAESSFVDPNRVRSIRLECKLCGHRQATVMLWPCRHVCVCTQCNATTKICPVCRSLTTTSVAVYLPIT